jgi:Chalcone isomerase-like
MQHGPSLGRRAVLLSPLLAWPCLAKATPVKTAPPEVAAELPGARLVGQGRLRFMGLAVYEARLWSAAPLSATNWAQTPLALEIEYARSLSGPRIAERSLQEMRHQGELSEATAERWLAAMRQIFPDVHKGDRITSVHKPGEGKRFFVNAVLKGEVRDAEFARYFLGIWLSPRTSEPVLRAALLGTA